MGVWIEMSFPGHPVSDLASLPAWECGLKSVDLVEIPDIPSHSLRGSVD